MAGPEVFTYLSESAAVQDHIDNGNVRCRCGAPMDRRCLQWSHRITGDIYCANGRDVGPSIADSECGTCGRQWDSVVNPTPAARCPWEHLHTVEESEPEPAYPVDVARVRELVAELAADLDEEGDDLGGVGPDDVIVGRAWAEALVGAVFGDV